MVSGGMKIANSLKSFNKFGTLPAGASHSHVPYIRVKTAIGFSQVVRYRAGSQLSRSCASCRHLLPTNPRDTAIAAVSHLIGDTQSLPCLRSKNGRPFCETSFRTLHASGVAHFQHWHRPLAGGVRWHRHCLQ